MYCHAATASPAYTTESDRYASITTHVPSKYTRKCIDGKITGCGNCVGYCRYEGHPGFLTAKLREEHDCLKKGCYYYIQKPKAKREPRKRISDEAHVLSIAREKTSDMEGLRVLKACCTDTGWKINFITISNEYFLSSIANQMSDELQCRIDFVELNYSFDRCVQLIMAS